MRAGDFVPAIQLLRRPAGATPAPVPSPSPVASVGTGRRPTYLRVVATPSCNHHCSYCHMEGDPRREGFEGGLPVDALTAAFAALAPVGLGKIKFVGGEPLLRRDLPEIISAARAHFPRADLSVITAGGVPPSAQERAFAAGLNRMNVSIHGFGERAFVRRGNRPALLHKRTRFLEALLTRGSPTKLNYVYSGPGEDDDLRALLEFAAGQDVLVNVLDDLNTRIGPGQLIELLEGWLGRPDERVRDHDPHSLDTTRLRWRGGPWVEIKTEHLGEHAPWRDCATCPRRTVCREGIFALRLTHDGQLRPCMDRSDLGYPLVPRLEQRGVAAVSEEIQDWLALRTGTRGVR